MSPSPRPRGGLEREVLAALAASTHPMTATQVLADLGGGKGTLTLAWENQSASVSIAAH